MTNRRYTNRSYLDAIARGVLVYDGAMGTSLQELKLSAEDFGGERLQGCNDYLVLSKPQAVEQVHRSFLEVGVDVIETNTFRSNRITLGEFGLADQVHEINRAAAALARRLADEYSTDEQPRFVAGSVGPSGKLPSADDPDLSDVSFDELVDIFKEQALGLIDGGVDLLLIETSQDILEVKAAIHGFLQAFEESGVWLPIQAQVTLDTSGRMLLGTDVAAAWHTLERLAIDVDRAELLHRARAHARADPLPGRARHAAGLVHPQRRPAAQRRRRSGVPARTGTLRRRHARVRRATQHQHRRRLLWDHAGTPASAGRSPVAAGNTRSAEHRA